MREGEEIDFDSNLQAFERALVEACLPVCTIAMALSAPEGSPLMMMLMSLYVSRV